MSVLVSSTGVLYRKTELVTGSTRAFMKDANVQRRAQYFNLYTAAKKLKKAQIYCMFGIQYKNNIHHCYCIRDTIIQHSLPQELPPEHREVYLSCNALLQSFGIEVMHFQHIQILVKSQMYVGNSVIQGVLYSRPLQLGPT